MGNDGGSIPTRRELVKEAARSPSTAQVKEAQRELQEHFWTTCPLSHKPLTRPIVSDCVGNLYNKDAILQFLLPGDESEGISSKADCEAILCGRVKGLRDVVELKFEVDSERRASATDKNEYREGWICPVTAKQLGPNVKSVYLVPCGHVFSEEAIRQLKGDKCLQCNESYSEDNIIPILPPKDADKERLMARGQKLAEQGLTHSLKKVPGLKKRKKNANGDSATPIESDGTPGGSKPPAASQSQLHNGASSRSNTSTPTPGASNGIKNASTAMLTARVLEEENERKRRRKMMGTNDNLDSLFTKDSRDGKPKGSDFMTRGYTIPAADVRR
ncbi:DUF602 domain-containing protein [Aspergillus sclerotialis]|uniref:DUF602 domain-containing protein n=1 Tax=Aspergillus sclerotialis TaxID=2070753 RepID=A0A3A3A1A7_9EURO|nr:DUF602 domain-containing protein [Aspergillus sclerotialis]